MTDQENTQQEPTMEEILASIRRIISEDNDEATKAAAPNGAAPAAAAAPAPAPVQPTPVEEPAPMAGMTNGVGHAPAAPQSAPAAPQSAPMQSSADVLELTQAQALPEMEPAAPVHQPIEEPQPLHQPLPDTHAEAANTDTDFAGSDLVVVDRDDHADDEAHALVSGDVESNAATAFQSLGRNVAVSREPSGSRTLETMVEDMMRPMLKEWLDDNLGDIVEDLVDREVRRISDRSRR
ncbi:MAG: DUF2497 domain-containing protein [Alphaproteobacteria bacterium]